MKSTEHWLVHEHTLFEILMKDCHSSIDIADWWAAEQFFTKLTQDLRYHMAQEEEILFPAFNNKCELDMQVSTLELFNEHSVMIDAFRKLKKAIDSRAKDDATDIIIDLEQLLVDHHKKEEKTFLPFASRLLFDDRDELVSGLNNFEVTNISRNWGI